ncbi:hypothetical protein VUR80DRAFT_2234 [Thermomyces stellatus]
MSVEIEPTELNFRRPFTEEVQELLTIRNSNPNPVAFKVKTTAPKQYCVRPNSGRIEAGQDVEVAVLLQAMKADPPKDAKCRDKFLVQSVNIPADQEFSSLQEVLDNTDKRSMQEKKIRVNWLPAESPGAPDAGPAVATTPLRPSRSHEESTTPDVSRAFTSPSNDDVSSPHPPPPYPEDAKPPKREAAEESPRASPVPSKPSPPSRAQPTYDELQAKLASAEQVIESLRQELQLRKRKSGAENEKSPPEPQVVTTSRQEPAGVPVKVVAILCFITFLLSYIFF